MSQPCVSSRPTCPEAVSRPWGRLVWRSLARSPAAQHGGNGAEQDAEVGLQAARADVEKVEFDPLLEGQLGPAGDLTQADQAGLNREALALRLGVALHLRRNVRAGAD